MNNFSIQNTFENRYATQQTVDSDNTNSQSVIRNKQVNFASQRHYSPISEPSKEDIHVAEIEICDRSARQTLYGQTDTNSDFNVINKKYSEAYNKLLKMPKSQAKFHGEMIAEFVIEALHNQRIDFSSIADAFCKKIDAQSNSDTVSCIAYILVEMVNTERTDIAAGIIANMVDNRRVDIAEYVLRSIKIKRHIQEIGKILGKLADDVKLEIVFDIICVSANRNHATSIATASSMLHAIANEGKINVVAEIINQMVYGEYTDNAIKVLVYTIKCLEETAARKIINEISDAKRIDIISKLLLRLVSMKFNNSSDRAVAKNILNPMLDEAKKRAKTKILQEINSQSFFAIADIIVEMINKNYIGFALSIFQAIDQKRRPDVFSAMDPDSRRTLCNILKECNML